MPDTPYCPLLSINKDVPVMCQEELCMWYVKQLKLCALTVVAYSNALNIQNPPQTTTKSSSSVKQTLTPETKKESTKPSSKSNNPFLLDDLD